MADLSYAEVSRLLKADFATGKLYWLPRTPDMFRSCGRPAEQSSKAYNAKFAGSEALSCVDTHGYLHGDINAKKCLAHRVIWLLFYGVWPPHHIDHINGDRKDNRIENLRLVANAENARNRRLRKDNKSGVNGVSLCKKSGKWVAQIVGDKKLNLGLFDAFEDAVAARKEAERRFGYHENHGSSA